MVMAFPAMTILRNARLDTFFFYSVKFLFPVKLLINKLLHYWMLFKFNSCSRIMAVQRNTSNCTDCYITILIHISGICMYFKECHSPEIMIISWYLKFPILTLFSLLSGSSHFGKCSAASIRINCPSLS